MYRYSSSLDNVNEMIKKEMVSVFTGMIQDLYQFYVETKIKSFSDPTSSVIAEIIPLNSTKVSCKNALYIRTDFKEEDDVFYLIVIEEIKPTENDVLVSMIWTVLDEEIDNYLISGETLYGTNIKHKAKETKVYPVLSASSSFNIETNDFKANLVQSLNEVENYHSFKEFLYLFDTILIDKKRENGF